MFHELAKLGLEQHVAARLQSAVMERRWRPNAETAPNCPRCESTNTKFCYYNNYSLTQPRYFCKSCRRYWTKGGSLRNVPVGGGCRKNRRGKAVRLAGHIDPNSTSLSSANSSPLMKRGQGVGEMPPDIDLALVYEKYISQPPDDHRQPNHFGQSQAAFSELHSDGSLPEFSGQLDAGFEAGIMQTDPGFVNLMPSNAHDQLQRFCNEDAAAMASVRADFRTEEFHGFGGFQCELGAQDVVNSQLQNSNWHDQVLGETLPEEQFGCCPDFPPNFWQSEDFLSCESPYRV